MMIRYGKIRITAAFGEWQHTVWQTVVNDFDLRPIRGHVETVEIDTSAADIVSEATSEFKVFAVQNLDPIGGNKITVSWEDSAANANAQRVDPGRILIIPDVADTADLEIQSTTADVWCRIFSMA